MQSPRIAPNGKPIESVWDYPRPPAVDPVEWTIQVIHLGVTVVDAPRAVRILETSHPPTYYVASEFVNQDCLRPSPSATFCEWKGVAAYVDLVVGDERVVDAGWRYDQPNPAYAELTGHYAFYAQKVDRCVVDGETVKAGDGSFYGSWITGNVVGPFKGGPGTSHW